MKLTLEDKLIQLKKKFEGLKQEFKTADDKRSKELMKEQFELLEVIELTEKAIKSDVVMRKIR